MSNELLENKTNEATSEVMEELVDKDLQELMESLDLLIINDKLANEIKALIHKATWDIKISKGDQRAHYVLEPVQELYELKNKYYQEWEIQEIPGLDKFIRKTSDYLYNFAKDMSVAEANHKNN